MLIFYHQKLDAKYFAGNWRLQFYLKELYAYILTKNN